jgi:pimeloyl-ACP methyl ester carboxylesterase
MNRRLAWITFVMGFLVSACNGAVSGTPTPSPVPYSTPSSIAWNDCGGGFQCGSIVVPLDYSNPSHGTIKLALARKRATDPSNRIGSLLLNPGGPGGSGIIYARNVAKLMASVNTRFDLVGFDPRGVGQSNPVRCLSGPQTDSFLAIDPVLDDAQERKTYIDSAKAAARACEQRSGVLLQFVDTASAARDMDVIRTALGDAKLTYFGLSYGTYLGQMYAHLFPTHVRALALDAVVDPSLDFTDRAIQRAAALEANLQAFLTYCRTFTSCMFGSSGDPGDALTALMQRLDRTPLQVGQRKLTRSLAMDAVFIALYSPRSWDLLQTALFNAADQGEGLSLLEIADSLNGRHADGTYSNFLAADAAIFCRDFAFPSDIATYDQIGATLSKVSTIFGPFLQYSGVTCSYWPVKPSATMAPLSADGAPPILLIGGTADPATPYASAQAVNKALAGSVLLTRHGYGHGSYDKSECVRQEVDAYLIDLKLPAAGTVCQTDAS